MNGEFFVHQFNLVATVYLDGGGYINSPDADVDLGLWFNLLKFFYELSCGHIH